MHTAGGYLDQKTGSPLSLGAAIAINGAIIGALLLSNPDIIPKPPTIIDLINPTEPPAPPPPQPVEQKTDPKPAPDRIATTQTVLPPTPENFLKASEEFPPLGGTVGAGEGTGTIPFDRPHEPVFVGPQIDRKYLAGFQPPYPPGKIRTQQEGVVVVRVLVGPDGRVKQVERVEAADEAFYKVTVEQALRKWRFQPATRDGVPVEGWRTMTVRFELKG